ncbi:MAG: hypothetical protein R3E90_13375 [Marinicella sp.]
MRTKIGLLTLLCGGLFWILYNQQQPDIVTPEILTTSSIDQPYTNLESATVSDEARAQSLSKNQEKTPTKDQVVDDTQQLLLQEISHQIFSDDPYVEQRSLQSLIGICTESYGLEDLFKISQGLVYAEQKRTIDAVKQQCLAYQNQYPNLMSESGKKITGIEPQSRLGLLLKQRKDFSQMTEQERNELESKLLFEALRERNSAILVDVSFSHRYSKPLSQELTHLLGSQDANYLGQISQLAIVKIACQYQNGINCNATSQLMLLICSQQPDSCGLDFSSWYQQNTLPGMNRDIEVLMAYYQNAVQ